MNNLSSQEILAELISFPTVSKDSNLDLINFIKDYLKSYSVDCELFYNEEKTKANLFAIVNDLNEKTILLSGHTDVVPVEGQDWTVESFKLTQKDSKLFGRGTTDMKGFIACVLSAIPIFKKFKSSIALAFSYDEEIGCVGVHTMLPALEKYKNNFRACIIGEPTQMRPILGHKGKLAHNCYVKGFSCHSAYPNRGVNAISFAAKLIVKLEEIAANLQKEKYLDYRFNPPFSSIQAGIIQGGSALNIVPDKCKFKFEIRSLPNFDANKEVIEKLKKYVEEELIPQMQKVQKNTGIIFEEFNSYPALLTDKNSDVANLIKEFTDIDNFSTAPYGTEGGLFNSLGIPTVVCGPGNMDQGHKPDEFIEISELNKCDKFMRKIAQF